MNPKFSPVRALKKDLKDGFHRMFLKASDCPRLVLVLPCKISVFNYITQVHAVMSMDLVVLIKKLVFPIQIFKIDDKY